MKLKDFIKKYTAHLTISDIKNVVEEYKGYIFSKPKNIDWLSSNLQGTISIVFTDKDQSVFFKSLNINEIEFKRDAPKIKGMNESWVVSNIAINILIAILLNKIIKSNEERTIKDLYIILALRATTSLYSSYFARPLDEKIARAVYDRLERKNLIKKLGSNYSVLEYKSNYLLKGESLYKLLVVLKDGEDLILAINAMHNYATQTVKSYYSKLMEYKDTLVTSSNITLYTKEGYMMDIDNHNQLYYQNMDAILANKELIKDRQIFELFKDMYNVKENIMYKLLDTIVEKNLKGDKDIELFGIAIVDATISYLYETEFYPPYDKSVDTLIKYLRDYWGNSKSKKKKLLEAKRYVNSIIVKDLKIKRTSTISRYSILACIYLFLLTVFLNKKYK